MEEERVAEDETMEVDNEGDEEEDPGSGDDDDDVCIIDAQVENELQQLRLNPNKREEERQRRREQRKMYRELLREARGDGISEKSFQELTSTINRADNVFKDVKNSREAAYDFELLRICSETAKRRTIELQTSLRRFDPEDFARKLTVFMGGELVAEERPRDSDSDSDPTGPPKTKARLDQTQWGKMGRIAGNFLKEPPSFYYLYGAFDPGVVEGRARQRRQTQQKQLAKLTEPRKDKSTSDEDKSVREVDRMHQALVEHCQEHGSICYFRLILDPDDFGRTIQNIFSLSFLLKDQALRLFLDDDGLPRIDLPPGTEGGLPLEEVGGAPSANNQCIFKLTMNEWEDLVETFGIEKAFLPPL